MNAVALSETHRELVAVCLCQCSPPGVNVLSRCLCMLSASRNQNIEQADKLKPCQT